MRRSVNHGFVGKVFRKGRVLRVRPHPARNIAADATPDSGIQHQQAVGARCSRGVRTKTFRVSYALQAYTRTPNRTTAAASRCAVVGHLSRSDRDYPDA